MSTFSHPARVYWEDTDAGGVVYHAQYLAFMERARSEWLRALGYGQERLRLDAGLCFVVRAMTLEFFAPAKLDDLLAVSVALGESRRASFSVTQRITRGGQLLVEAQVRIAAVAADSFRPVAIPAALLAHLRATEF